MTTDQWITRIERMRAEDGIDSSRGDQWRTFEQKIRTIRMLRPLPIGPVTTQGPRGAERARRAS